MNKRILLSMDLYEIRVGVLEDGRLAEYLFERQDYQRTQGNIYKGTVAAVIPGIAAAFVDIGEDRNAFLYVSDTLAGRKRLRSIAAGEDTEEEETSMGGVISAEQLPGMGVLQIAPLRMAGVAWGLSPPCAPSYVVMVELSLALNSAMMAALMAEMAAIHHAILNAHAPVFANAALLITFVTQSLFILAATRSKQPRHHHYKWHKPYSNAAQLLFYLSIHCKLLLNAHFNGIALLSSTF